jgi:hypothetical protein
MKPSAKCWTTPSEVQSRRWWWGKYSWWWWWAWWRRRRRSCWMVYTCSILTILLHEIPEGILGIVVIVVSHDCGLCIDDIKEIDIILKGNG